MTVHPSSTLDEAGKMLKQIEDKNMLEKAISADSIASKIKKYLDTVQHALESYAVMLTTLVMSGLMFTF